MDFDLTEEQKSFREEVRSFLQTEIKQGTFVPKLGAYMEGFSQRFSKKLAERGWIGLTWPKTYGGQGRSYVDRTILLEELLKAQAPLSYYFVGERQIGPALMRHGSDELKQEFLPRIMNAEISFCLLLSEPDAGSDLASLRTTAIKEGNSFIVNGQKIWTTMGHLADFGWLLARTDLDPTLRKHKTISEFILDMKTPGVTVEPVINMAGAHSFNEVFLDNVIIPEKYLVGTLNSGFSQIMEQVVYERAGMDRLMQNYVVKELILDYAKRTKKNGRYLWEDPLVRNTIATIEIEFNIGRNLCYYVAWLLDQGKIPNYEAAVCKTFCTEFEQKLSDLTTGLMGLYGQLLPGCERAPYEGAAAESYLWSPSYTIQGGAVEILKNIIALRGLNLRTQ